MRIFNKTNPTKLQKILEKKTKPLKSLDQCNKMDFVKECLDYFLKIFNLLTYLIIANEKKINTKSSSSFPILDDTNFDFSSKPYRIEKTPEADGIKYLLEFVDFLEVFGFHITPI